MSHELQPMTDNRALAAAVTSSASPAAAFMLRMLSVELASVKQAKGNSV